MSAFGPKGPHSLTTVTTTMFKGWHTLQHTATQFLLTGKHWEQADKPIGSRSLRAPTDVDSIYLTGPRQAPTLLASSLTPSLCAAFFLVFIYSLDHCHQKSSAARALAHPFITADNLL